MQQGRGVQPGAVPEEVYIPEQVDGDVFFQSAESRQRGQALSRVYLACEVTGLRGRVFSSRRFRPRLQEELTAAVGAEAQGLSALLVGEETRGCWWKVI